MQQIKRYMAERDAADLEVLGLIGINLACIWTVVLCLASIM